jgi:SAM-dependent methyltransferase
VLTPSLLLRLGRGVNVAVGGSGAPFATVASVDRRRTAPMARPDEVSRSYWDRAARENAAWYVATGYQSESDAFFAQGGVEVLTFLEFCGVSVGADDTVVEIGCGVGRMTRKLTEMARQVLAADVSEEMLERCARNLADKPNVSCLLLPGDGRLEGIAGGSVDLVFSYITLQHVPSHHVQCLYLGESARVLRPGGHIAVQVRGSSATARALDWAGFLQHALAGHSTLSRAWRGARLSDSDVRRALPAGMDIEVRSFDRRHRWVVARKGF